MNKSIDLSQTSHKNGNIFGLPFAEEDAELVLFPVPWEVTVSYRAGTVNGPAAILDASSQLDLFRNRYENAWEHGIFMRPIPASWQEQSNALRILAIEIIQALEEGKLLTTRQKQTQDLINQSCDALATWVEEETGNLLDEGKKVGLIGGDHSTPLGFYRALATRYPNFGILQIDAHMDLRDQYEGFTQSHASIMHNALQLPQITRLVQVGIRDYSEPEVMVTKQHPDRYKIFYDEDLKSAQFKGETWHQQVEKIIQTLPEHVYLSVDIDGLNPSLCPHTGTPVPGGLSFEEAIYLIQTLEKSDKKLIGFDLVEVAPGTLPDDLDGNVGARMLYQLCMSLLC